MELEINSVDRTSFLEDYEVTQTIERYSSSATVEVLDDDNQTLYNSLVRFQPIVLYDSIVSTRKVFKGFIVDILPNSDNSKGIILECQDKWSLIVRSHVTKTYTNQTASAIVQDLLNTYLPNQFTYNNVQSTSVTISPIYRGRNLASVLLELALTSGFIIYVDEDDDIHFVPEENDSSGKVYDYNAGDLYSENFANRGNNIVNAVLVQGRGGNPSDGGSGAKSAFYVDTDLLTLTNGLILPMDKIIDTSLQTDQECYRRGEYEVNRRNQTPVEATVIVALDTEIRAGKTIQISNLTHRGYVGTNTFICRTVIHRYRTPETELSLIYTTKTNEDIVADILYEAREVKEVESDESASYPRFNNVKDKLYAEAIVAVDKRQNNSSFHGKSFAGKSYHGVQSTTEYIELLPAESINFLNDGAQAIIKIIGQLVTVPNELTATNAHIAISNDNSLVQFTDTAIGTELARKDTEVGFPNVVTDHTIVLEFIITNTELTEGIIRKIGLFNDSSNGNLFFAGVLSSPIVKNSGENIRFTITITLSAQLDYITNAGLNKIRDLITNNDNTFLDNGTARIEINTTTPFRDAMRTDDESVAYPTQREAGDQMKFSAELTVLEINDNSLNGETFNKLDLYDSSVGGIKVMSCDLPISVPINTGEKQYNEIILEVGRK